MIGFEKTHFRWKDPSHNPRATSKLLRSGFLKLMGVIALSCAAFLLLLGLIYGAVLVEPLVALAAIVLLMGAIYIIQVWCPPYVVVKDTHMYRGLNDETAEEWRYEDISGCRFSSRKLGRRSFEAMEIETRDGERAEILLAHRVSPAALRSFLRAKGVREL